MASNTSDTLKSDDDENLHVIVKTEAEEPISSENEEILPGYMVSVEVKEDDQQTSEFTSKPTKATKSLNPDKRKPRRLKRKVTETLEEKRERLERDRERKSWARKNETPEQRKTRLEYHKKYKRKSRAKPKELLKSFQNDPVIRDIQSMSCDHCLAKFNSVPEWQEHLKTHPWQGSNAYDPLSESEKIEVKVEPIDFDGDPFDDGSESPDSDKISPDSAKKGPNSAKINLNTTKLRREQLTYTIHCAIVSKMFKGRPIDDICKLYNTTPEVINEIWEERDKFEVQKPGYTKHRFLNATIENKVLEWMRVQKDNNIQVSGRMIQITAEGYANELGFVAFDGSRKWLDRFKKKHDIVFGTRRRDYTATPDNKVKTQFFMEQWTEARDGMSDHDIYTADELGVFYNPSKNRIQKLRGKKFVQGCVKDRLSIFVCTNATGTDKKKLLVCGIEDPLLHSYRDPQTLPVLYVRHAQAQFTTKIFEEYVTCWNKELELSNKKALLVLDRATIHTKMQLSHLKLLFLPYKSKSSLLPIRNGVYSRFRAEFRRLILQDKVMKCLNGVDRNLTCLEALSMLEKSWERVPPEVIGTSFISLGYDIIVSNQETVLTPKVTDNDEETMCDVLKDFDVESYYTDVALLDEYLIVDDELLSGQGTNPSVFGGNHKTAQKNEIEEHLPIGTERPGSDDAEVSVKESRALQDLEIVKKYLQSQNTDFGTFTAFMDIEKFMRLSCTNT